MKTLVFHSVKGGVGRTLALCNVARALAETDRKVLMLDFDYLAPGLHHKWGKPPGSGYLEYLEHLGIEDRAGGKSVADRWRELGRNIDRIGKNLYLLRAGDETRPAYWEFISSYWFHRLFYQARSEIGGLNPDAFPMEWLDLNIRAFREDQKLIEVQFAPDFLLVDCKTSLDSGSASFLLDWADILVHFFPPNEEGIYYALSTAQALLNSPSVKWKGESSFVPVITRAPDHMTQKEGVETCQAISERWADFSDDLDNWVYARSMFGPDDFVLLSETEELEMNERILYANRQDRDLGLELSHDYLALCARLAPPPGTSDLSESEQWWYQKRGMDPRVRILTKRFERNIHLGTMRNIDDDRPNIAMRIKTFHLMLDILLGRIATDSDTQDEALRDAGRQCGKDFADELNGIFDAESEPRDVISRVNSWAEFDSGVGFGTIHPKDIQSDLPQGYLEVVGDPFAGDKFPREQRRDLKGFFIGYIEGVLSEIYHSALDVQREIWINEIEKDALPESISTSRTEHLVPDTRITYYSYRTDHPSRS